MKRGRGRTRREVLQGLAAAAGVAAVPTPARAALKYVAEDPRPATEQEPTHEVMATPEYERHLEKLLLTVPTTIHGAKDRPVDIIRGHLRRVYQDLLRNIPEYTHLEIVVREDMVEHMKSALQELQIQNQATFHILPAETERLEVWAQDYGEPITVDGEDAFLISMDAIPISSIPDDQRAAQRVAVGKQLESSMNVVQAPFAFEGGDMTFDRTEKGLRVLVGHHTISRTINEYKRRGQQINQERVLELIQAQFPGAEVVFMGEARYGFDFFAHLDQSFILLADNTAVVNQYGDAIQSSSLVQLHEKMKQQLEDLGYRVFTIENDEFDDAWMVRTSVNAIPYIDKNTGEKKILFPVFPNELQEGADGIDEITQEHLIGKAARAYETYVQAGYTPIPVRDLATHQARGSVHCSANVLAQVVRTEDFRAV